MSVKSQWNFHRENMQIRANMSVKYFNCRWQHRSGNHMCTHTCNCTSCVRFILSNPNISIGLHRCYFFLSHELIITWYFRLYFIYVRVRLFLCSAHIELGHWKVKYTSYLRLRDWFKNKPRRIEKKKKSM